MLAESTTSGQVKRPRGRGIEMGFRRSGGVFFLDLVICGWLPSGSFMGIMVISKSPTKLHQFVKLVSIAVIVIFAAFQLFSPTSAFSPPYYRARKLC